MPGPHQGYPQGSLLAGTGSSRQTSRLIATAETQLKQKQASVSDKTAVVDVKRKRKIASAYTNMSIHVQTHRNVICKGYAQSAHVNDERSHRKI